MWPVRGKAERVRFRKGLNPKPGSRSQEPQGDPKIFQQVLEVDRFVDELRRGYSSRGQAVHLRQIPPKSPIYANLSDPLPGPLRDALRNIGVDQLYTHQCAAIEAARAGERP